MARTISYVGHTIVVLLVIDMMILMATMLQVANGAPTPHIPFWDEQIRVVLSITQ